jgi:hypothetical protein
MARYPTLPYNIIIAEPQNTYDQIQDWSSALINELNSREEQFAKLKKIGYNGSNFIAEQTGPQSNYGNLK